MVAELLGPHEAARRSARARGREAGLLPIEVPGLTKEPPVTYYLQLPPEYDPYRHYPGDRHPQWPGHHAPSSRSTGGPGRGPRTARAPARPPATATSSIAPVWTVEHQKQYGYSAHEHAAVLNSLRDACRRFSIDTDRVFLSGHSMGGDAAWDMGLAHPDLWAGVIPDRGPVRSLLRPLYWENAKYVPFYVVAGELDGAELIEERP